MRESEFADSAWLLVLSSLEVSATSSSERPDRSARWLDQMGAESCSHVRQLLFRARISALRREHSMHLNEGALP